jgi:hypothetical protein
VSDALSNVGRIGDMALDAFLIYVVFRLTYVVWRLQLAIRVGTIKLEHFFTEIETLRARIDGLEEKH